MRDDFPGDARAGRLSAGEAAAEGPSGASTSQRVAKRHPRTDHDLYRVKAISRDRPLDHERPTVSTFIHRDRLSWPNLPGTG